MGHKVVINNCYGGFSLSEDACFALNQLGIKTECEGRDIPRHLPELVYVVDQLGEGANGRSAKLVITELKGDRYIINEYDGWESIHEPETVNWIVVR